MTHQEWTCTRKRRYAKRWYAFLAQKSVERRTGDRIDIYRCGYCGGYHIGHNWRKRRFG